MLSSFFTTILTITMLLANPIAAWTLTVYPETQDCTVHTYIKYDSDDTSPQCFTAGRPGEDVTCQTTIDNGNTWTDCADDAPASGPGKLSFIISKGNYCAWSGVGRGGCAGISLASEGECL